MSPTPPAPLPQLEGRPVVTDGGLETDLLFHHGVDLPDFAAFPLLDDERGRALLGQYYDAYVAIAERAGAAVQLETPTWRASLDWGSRLGYTATDLHRLNVDAVRFLRERRDRAAVEAYLVSGNLGPRGDGYASSEAVDPMEAEAYHRPQVEALAEGGADLITALTLTGVGEAVGVVRAARSTGLPVAVSFTVEQDGRLPGGTTLAEAIGAVDAEAAPDYYMVNCAHPTHIAEGLAAPGDWRARILGVRPNASTLSHAELDEATELDEGDPAELAASNRALRDQLPDVTLVGGCCGTDARHVAALWGVA